MIKILAGNSGAPLANLYSFGERDWLVTTPDGYFDGSTGALKQTIWRRDGKNLPFEKVEFYAKQFKYPGLLPAVISGGGVVKKEITPFPAARMVQEVGLINSGEMKMVIDIFFVELSNAPSARGVIISYRQKGKITQTKRLEAAILSHIRFRQQDASKISFVNGGEGKGLLFEFYIVPEGASPPAPQK